MWSPSPCLNKLATQKRISARAPLTPGFHASEVALLIDFEN
jgi:hypothetical protein